ncbi:hypothetical protein ILUMI_14439 [Ignelater luminosus]|uniref:Transposase n=1 Tax=Ignelater luminosus TaxID=2038154 RepID=A0A8K0GA05_IGNLU|nr:hypothetical protein ILUMI_14439 [Ignelater luminosus]
MSLKELEFRNHVYKFYEENRALGKLYTYKHFLYDNVSKSTIYNIIQHFEKGLTVDRRNGSGCKAVKITPQKLRQIENLFENNDSVSLHTAARKYDVSPGYLCKTLKKKTKLRYRKKQTIPKRSDKQIALAKPKCNLLLSKFHHHDFILDDESYFT